MANDTERGSTAGNREKQSGSAGSQQMNRGTQPGSGSQMNRDTQSGSSSQMSGSQSTTRQSGSSIPGSKTGRPEDQPHNQPGGLGTVSSQHANEASTRTGSGQSSQHSGSGQSSSSGRTPGSGSSGSSSGSDRG